MDDRTLNDIEIIANVLYLIELEENLSANVTHYLKIAKPPMNRLLELSRHSDEPCDAEGLL